MEQLELAVLWDHLVDLETLDLRDQLERKVHLVHLDHLEYPERMANLAHLVKWDRKETLERQVCKEALVLEDPVAPMGQRVNLEQSDIQDLLVHLVTLV